MTKFIFVTGGVVSGLGKGIAAASIGLLLKKRGLRVSVIKLDPYINVDPGTMSPYQHGEVFVTEDGGETDLDLGHYERFINVDLTKNSSFSAGQIYSEVIGNERNGFYLGGTVQVVPHITNVIKEKIHNIALNEKADVVLIEIGGTVGDIESQPFLEAIRQFRHDVGREDTLFLHLTLVPYLKASQELKTKPTQHSVKDMQRHGIQPDMLLCRAEQHIPQETLDKIALFCDVRKEMVFEGIDVESIYEVPLNFYDKGIDRAICRYFKFAGVEPELSKWRAIVQTYKNPDRQVEIALVGKYVQLPDAYLSVTESLKHAAVEYKTKIKVRYIDSELLENGDVTSYLEGVSGILVPGGFGDRGVEGKILAAKYARENNIPYFGICLGMQVAVIDFARNVCGLKDANSTEFGKCVDPVIHLMSEQKEKSGIGGTMRLGAYECSLVDYTHSSNAYGKESITERHRHRYEFNNAYKELFKQNGFVFSGVSPQTGLVEIVENPTNDWFVAAQFHPEFKSRIDTPHPLFSGFVHASIQKKYR